MYDQSFNSKSLSSLLKQEDLTHVPFDSFELFKESTIKHSLFLLKNDQSKLFSIKKIYLKNKPAYTTPILSDEIIIRKISQNIKSIRKCKSTSRAFVILNLKSLLSEGIPYRIYRLDIENFYESIDTLELISLINRNEYLSNDTKNLLENLLVKLQAHGNTGLPRGMAISAILSDIAMQDFDEFAKNMENVFFYARYVDDIIIITNSSENDHNFVQNLENKLPPKLTFHKKGLKFKILSLPLSEKKGTSTSPTPVGDINYLGYNFDIYEPYNGSKHGDRRPLKISISNTKISKIKTRITKSFLIYKKDHNSALLLSRIKFLTSNFHITNKTDNRRKLSGIYFNYPFINNTQCLSQLDSYLRKTVFLNGQYLSSKSKRQLLSFSFLKGHKLKIFAHFHSSLLHEIQRCWKYE